LEVASSILNNCCRQEDIYQLTLRTANSQTGQKLSSDTAMALNIKDTSMSLFHTRMQSCTSEGAANTRSHFQWLINRYKINKAEKVLLTGASAGGIGTFIWTNYFRNLLD